MLFKEFPSSKSFDVKAGLVTSTEIDGGSMIFLKIKSLYMLYVEMQPVVTSSGHDGFHYKTGLNGT